MVEQLDINDVDFLMGIMSQVTFGVGAKEEFNTANKTFDRLKKIKEELGK